MSDEPVWSANTGRSASGKMLGSLVTIKSTIKIEWAGLTPDEADTIRNVIADQSKPFHSLSLTDVNGQTTTKTVYFGTPTYTIQTVTGGGRITGVAVNAIEQ